MGIDIVTLANNHSMDFGIEALKDSFTTLNNADILYSGAGNNLEEARDIKYIEVQNKTFAYLSASRVIPEPGWNAGSNKAGMLTTYDPTNLVEDIKEARENSDFVVVYVHWGIEKATKPEEYQRNLAKAYIDAGADLVVGSHPHVLQGIEYYNSKPIVYSLGNFIFYNAIAQTAVLKVTVNEQNEATLKLLPARAENAQTSFVTLESVVTGFYKSMEEISFGIKFEPDGTVVSE
jgi:poly-gamma-glutamate synthesis protein (capsule biosynthesis protein)